MGQASCVNFDAHVVQGFSLSSPGLILEQCVCQGSVMLDSWWDVAHALSLLHSYSFTLLTVLLGFAKYFGLGTPISELENLSIYSLHINWSGDRFRRSGEEEL